jgi:hypothetical protein
MLLTLRRVASVELVAGNITQRQGRFQKKCPPSVNKSLRKEACRGAVFFRNPDAVGFAHGSASSRVKISGRRKKHR